MIRFIDLFAGIGGIRLGFEQACQSLNLSTQCELSSEIDKNACETYFLNFNERPKGDIREIKTFPDFDFLLAGFPCQAFSYAGKMNGFGDTRGTLFFEIERILRQYKPKAFLLENVRGLTTHDNGRTFKTILDKLESIGYGVQFLKLNSSDFGIPQNRMRVYIVGILGCVPNITLDSNWGAVDSHKYKSHSLLSFFKKNYPKVYLRDILDINVSDKYYCSSKFTKALVEYAGGDLRKLYGYRLIDFRGGHSIHSWDLGIKGYCTESEVFFMNALISNRRKKSFGVHQDGKKLTKEQIQKFYDEENLDSVLESLTIKGYLKYKDGLYNPTCGNMSFEVFKILDPNSISITLVSSDAHKLGVIVDKTSIRRITPRECARLQGFPDDFLLHPSDSSAYKQIGNSVSVPVIKEVACDFLKNNKIFGDS